MRLTMADTSEINPTDISYVHCVYAPLSVRLVEQLINDGWKQLQDVIGLLSGPTIEETLPVPNGTSENNSDAPKVILVFFIGGCTFAEVNHQNINFFSKLFLLNK